MQGDFVIQLRPTMDLAAGQFEGRVEHIDTGRSAQFHSAEELLAFLATNNRSLTSDLRHRTAFPVNLDSSDRHSKKRGERK